MSEKEVWNPICVILQRNLKVRQIVGQLGNKKTLCFSELSLRSCSTMALGEKWLVWFFTCSLMELLGAGAWFSLRCEGVQCQSRGLWPGRTGSLLVTHSCKLRGHQQGPEICAFRLEGVCDGRGVKHENVCIGIWERAFHLYSRCFV